MSKDLFLTIARSVRIERLADCAKNTGGLAVNAYASSTSEYEKLVGSLSDSECSLLLESLSNSLEKERRRCKARKWNYDAGRHISLYTAVKTLAARKEKPPA